MSKLKAVARALPHAGGYLLAMDLFVGGPAVLLPPAFVFFLIPTADLFLPQFSSGEAGRQESGNTAFRVVVWCWVPLQLAMIGWGLVHGGGIIAAISTGVCGGAVGMTFAHELLHSRSRFERVLAEILLNGMTYPQLCVEHLTGHHRNYGKLSDYGTARFGEGYYRAAVRCIRGSWKTTWTSEKNRLRRSGFGPFNPRNRAVRYLLTIAVIYCGITWLFGIAGLTFFALQSAISIAILLCVNYVEHYGLVRRELAAGVYEPTGPHLSWDAPGLLTDIFGLRIQRHADHHRVMSRPYDRLQYQAHAPRLPCSYGFMLVLAAVPPLWRAVMNPRVVAWQRSRTITSRAADIPT